MADQTSAAYGGFWIRVLAVLVDSVVLMAIGIVLVTVSVMGAVVIGELGALIGQLLWVLVVFLYFPLMHASARQATFGKQMLGMKVTDYAGNRISLLRSFGRYLGTWVSSAVMGIGYLMAGFTSKKQALHDLLASTLVVREQPARVGLAIVICLLPIIGSIVGFMVFGAALVAMVTGAALGTDAVMKPVPQPPAQVIRPMPKPRPAPQSKPAPKPAPQAVAKVPMTPKAPAPAATPVAKPTETAAKPAMPAVAPKPAATPPKAAEPMKIAKASPPATAKPAAKTETKPAAPAAAGKPMQKPTVKRKPRRRAAPPAPTGSALRYNDLHTAVWRGDLDAVGDLLDFGRWIDKPGYDGMTPLMSAVNLDHHLISQLLLERGADPNAVGRGGATPLSIARRNKSATLESLLRRYGAR